MLRLIVVVLFVAIFLILSLPIQLVIWLLSKKWPSVPDYVSYPLVGWCFKVILFLSGTKMTVLGEDRIPRDTAVLYVGNHRSYFDIVTTYTRVIRPTGYLAKDDLKKIPGLNIWMTLMHCIFLDRKDLKQGLKCILDCIELIKKGISVTIFPEGTRSTEEDKFLPFHDGSFKVATKTGCPIVPIAINNTGAIFEDHLPYIKPARVTIEYLDPIYLDELSADDKKHIAAYVQSKIEDAYYRNKEL